MDIKRYSQADEALLFDMLREEGEEWSDYYNQRDMTNIKSIGFKHYLCRL